MKKTDNEYLTIVKVFTMYEKPDTPVLTNEIIQLWHKATDMWITPREWRMYKDNFNEMYRRGENDWFICGFSTGYVLTNDNDKIKRDMRNKRRQALALLMRNSDTKTAMMLQHNFKMDLEDE